MSYRVVEIFDSIDGEGIRTGALASFIRLAGCNLRCTYCDTLYALYGEQEPCMYEEMEADEILRRMNRNYMRVTLTGGEPLLAPGADLLVNRLADEGFEVNIETNGAVDVHSFLERIRRKERVFFTVDYKLPGSGMEHKMLKSNFRGLRSCDVIKFVCADLHDMEVMKEKIREFTAEGKQPHMFAGAVFESLEPKALAAFLQAHPCLRDVRLQMQIHKLIWAPDAKGV